MNWFKRQQPLSLIQSSDLPYVILKDGVRLCYSNFYEEYRPAARLAGHVIHFNVPKSAMIRQSTYLFRFKKFPVTIPFEDIHRLDSTIIDGKILRHASTSDEIDDKKVSFVHMERLPDIFDDYSNQLEDYDHNFILHNGEEIIAPEARLLELDGQADLLYHKEWGRTCVAVVHKTWGSDMRKYCWTNFVPDMDMVCFGLESVDDKESIQSCFDDMGVTASVIWSD